MFTARFRPVRGTGERASHTPQSASQCRFAAGNFAPNLASCVWFRVVCQFFEGGVFQLFAVEFRAIFRLNYLFELFAFGALGRISCLLFVFNFCGDLGFSFELFTEPRS